MNGQLQGDSSPGAHGPNIRRRVSGTDIRVSFRFRLPPNGFVGCDLRGDNRILEREWAVMAIHVWADRAVACDNTVLHPKDSPEAAQLAAQVTLPPS